MRTELRGRSLVVARILVVVFLSFVAIASVRWGANWVAARASYANSVPEVATSSIMQAALTASEVVALVAVIVWWTVAGLVYFRRSHDLLGLYLTIAFFAFGPCLTDPALFTPVTRTDTWQLSVPILLFANSLTLPWVFIFPDGRPIPRWAWIPIVVWVGWYIARIATVEADPRGIWSFVWTVFPVFAVGTFVYRYFRASDPVQRQQIKWVFFAGVAFIVPWAVVVNAPEISPQLAGGVTGFYFATAAAGLYALAQIALPTAIAIAVFRQGLLDVDLLINRTLTYAALTAILVGLFVLVSSVASRVVQTVTGQQADVVTAIVAVGVALTFVPLRSALLRIADRFMSGSRILTVLFIDIVESTSLTVRLGDHAWRGRLERFRAIVRARLKSYGGEEVDTAGDGFFATFPAPGRAIRCAVAIVQAVRAEDLQIRAALHIGEVETFGSSVAGVAVHIGARVLGLAGPSEVLVTGAMREVVAGSNIELADRGVHSLKGVPGTSQVYAVTSA